MANDTRLTQTAVPIPPPPGGGSWIWDGKQWLARSDISITPAIETPVEVAEAVIAVAAETRNTD